MLEQYLECVDRVSAQERGRWRSPIGRASGSPDADAVPLGVSCPRRAVGGVLQQEWKLMSHFCYPEDSSLATGSEANYYMLSIPAAKYPTLRPAKNQPLFPALGVTSPWTTFKPVFFGSHTVVALAVGFCTTVNHFNHRRRQSVLQTRYISFVYVCICSGTLYLS